MYSKQIEQNIEKLVESLDKSTFIYDLLLAYGQPKAAVTRLRKGDYNLAEAQNDILWKKRLYYRADEHADLYDLIDTMKNNPEAMRQQPRFVIVTDYEQLLATDTETNDTLDTPMAELSRHHDFFLPWAGMEKTQLQRESMADRKAAERMGRLYEIILLNNPPESNTDRHSLNVFLARLLFCFFAEDTGIFPDGHFINSIASHTQEDGSDLQTYLQRLFTVLNSEERSSYPQFLQQFPYVNGGLFTNESPVPAFNRQARNIIIECGALNWKAINPDIFGSMMQAVVQDEQRGEVGMHYTSVVNIMKVIEPLFLDNFKAELDRAGESSKRLNALLERIYNLRIFDPACGSGNFLIIAYKELARLEIEIFKRLRSGTQLGFNFLSRLSLSQFYGIELDDFAHETAKLSLWLAEHQMNLEFEAVFGAARPTLPLSEGGNIVCGNALWMKWEDICPYKEDLEIFVLGNPPYRGARQQSRSQKADVSHMLDHLQGYNNLDYIACWFVKAANFIRNTDSESAFVSTNSLSQGTQVALLWPSILADLEIGFAHRSFQWSNNARGSAGVTCVIIGLRKPSSKPKKIFTGSVSQTVRYINAYLVNASDIYIYTRRKQLSDLPEINYGSFALDDGNYTLSQDECDSLVKMDSSIKSFVKEFRGAKELIQGGKRYCIWIDHTDKIKALGIPALKRRIDNVREWRSNSSRKATQELANFPHRFAEIRQPDSNYLAFPTVSSERREYVPIIFSEPEVVASNQIYIVPNPPPYIFAIISSRMHMTWVRAVAGRLETRIRYSSALCYNTFPFPAISKAQKETLEEHVFAVLEEREAHPEKTLAQLYDPDKMPAGLRQAHREMDLAVERCYRAKPFASDEERLEYLFTLYEEMIEAEKIAEEEAKAAKKNRTKKKRK